LRDTVKLAVDSTREVRRKNVQYNTGFLLAPGSYHLKFVIRENQTGRMGSFETDVQIPDLRKTPLKMSSVVLSSLRAPATAKKTVANPLVRDQMELVPNITHVFAPDQHLYLQYEVYDAAKGKSPASAATNGQNGTAKDAPAAKPSKDSIRVFTNIEFLQGATKIYESKPVVANEVTAPDRRAVIFQMDLPLQALKPNYVKVDRVVIRNLNSQTARGKLDRIVNAGKKLGIGNVETAQNRRLIVQSPTAAVLRGNSTDSAKPRRIGPRTKAGTSRSGANEMLVAFRGNSLRRSKYSPASFRNSAEKPMSSARSTPQNHSFSS